MKLIAKVRGEQVPVAVERHGGGYRVVVDGVEHIVDLVTAEYLQSLRFEDGRQFLILHRREGAKYLISFGDRSVQLEIHDPLALRRGSAAGEAAASGRVVALMPGRVVRVSVQPGDEVTAGMGLLVLEAMKMENEITAPCDGIVKEVSVSPGQTVDGGADLVIIEC